MDDSQPNLIFMVGLTGSGKSHLKTILFKEFNIKKNPPVSVDDIFEKDEESISIFHKLYTFHFGKDCTDDSKLSENISFFTVILYVFAYFCMILYIS